MDIKDLVLMDFSSAVASFKVLLITRQREPFRLVSAQTQWLFCDICFVRACCSYWKTAHGMPFVLVVRCAITLGHLLHQSSMQVLRLWTVCIVAKFDSTPWLTNLPVQLVCVCVKISIFVAQAHPHTGTKASCRTLSV